MPPDCGGPRDAVADFHVSVLFRSAGSEEGSDLGEIHTGKIVVQRQDSSSAPSLSSLLLPLVSLRGAGVCLGEPSEPSKSPGSSHALLTCSVQGGRILKKKWHQKHSIGGRASQFRWKDPLPDPPALPNSGNLADGPLPTRPPSMGTIPALDRKYVDMVLLPKNNQVQDMGDPTRIWQFELGADEHRARLLWLAHRHSAHASEGPGQGYMQAVCGA